MLHDPSHYEPPPVAEEIRLGERDRDVLRRLADPLPLSKTAPGFLSLNGPLPGKKKTALSSK